MDSASVASSPPARSRRFNALPDTRHDRTEVLAWARALMAGSKVMLVDEDNHGQGWILPEEAVLNRRPAAIEVRADWLAVDSDEPDLLPRLLELEAALRRDGLRPFVVRSGGRRRSTPSAATVAGLRAHLWVQVLEPALLAEYKRRAKALAFDVREGSDLCRPPLSPHRHGHPVAVLGGHQETPRWQSVLDGIARKQRIQTLEAHYWRNEAACRKIMSDLGDPTWSLPETAHVAAMPPKPTGTQRRPLNWKWGRLVRDGVPDGQRHQTIMSEAIVAADSHWTADEFFLVIMNGKLGEKVLEQGNEAAQRRYVSGIWRKAVARAASPSVPGGPPVQAEVARFRAAAAVYYWKPRSGTTDRTILEARFDIVARTGKLEHDASDRDLAEATGFDASTVSRSNGRSQKSGWLMRVTRAEQRGFATSACWKVQIPSQFPISAAHASTTAGGAKTCAAPIGKSHDAFRHRGLGKDTLRVWSHLDAMSSVKAAVLASTLDLSLSTTYYHLAKLRKVGLAVKGPGGWLRAGAATLDAVAEIMGVAGIGAAQKVKHRLDRKTRKEERERRIVEKCERMLGETRTRSVEKVAKMPAEPVQTLPAEPAQVLVPVAVAPTDREAAGKVEGEFKAWVDAGCPTRES